MKPALAGRMRHDVIKSPSLYTSAGRHLGLLRLGVADLYFCVKGVEVAAEALNRSSWKLKGQTCQPEDLEAPEWMLMG
ncbi:hypothetical protein GH733_010841 [Mirounga leonina]|nr:hypothetical protein GH733_010841 [Mirounga leonina]